MSRRLALCLGVVVVAGGLRVASAGWGIDLDEAGPTLIEGVRPRLLAIVRASPGDRPELVRAFVRTEAEHAIEAVKRFRNPELVPLFRALLDHPEPQVVHRALVALERLEDGASLERAWALLAHEDAGVREKAGVACLRLWSAPGARVPAAARATVDRLLATETDAHVRAVRAAVARRAAGTLPVERVSDEVRVTDADGLILTPFLRRMSTAPRVAPGYVPDYVTRTEEGPLAVPPVATRWTTPLRIYGREEFPPGRRLQPFGHLRDGGTRVHTGIDVGAFHDGAGFYACAAGVVRMVYTGSDMGTLIVLEHRPTERERVTILYMHASDVVLVRAGESVESGQLLGSMGLGYSIENGGHFAHLHLGVYPGPFVLGHNYGYKDPADGLDDWHDPAAFLAERIQAKRGVALPVAR
jgi:murein DD-endopeptidase MepM/ murein hydrolase activator NlpD